MELSVSSSTFQGPIENFQSNIVNSVNHTNHYYYTDLHDFLTPLDPERRHITIRDKRTKGTGEWLLRSAEFRGWHASAVASLLCCRGDPGIGKTYLACHVIETLRQGEASIVGFVYCDYQDKERHTARNILGTLLSQVIPHLAPEADIVEQLQFRSRRKHTLSSEETTDFLCEAVSRISKTVRLCLDALDELDPGELNNLLRSFGRLCQVPNVRIFLTGRCNAGIEDIISRQLATVPITYLSICTSQTSLDIQCFLSQKLEDDLNPELVDNELKAKVFDHFSGEESTFLLASLSIETLLEKSTIRERWESIDANSLNLNETYERMLERIKKQDNGYGMKILHWILFSERPLNIDELRYALAIHPNTSDLDPSKDLPSASIVNKALGLVTVDNPGYVGGVGTIRFTFEEHLLLNVEVPSRSVKGIGIVRFVHFTFKEYLLANSLLHFPTGHTLLAEATLTYLGYNSIKNEHLVEYNSYPQTLYDYAVRNWGRHAQQGEEKKLIQSVCNFLRSKNCQMIWKQNSKGIRAPVATALFSPIHAVSYFGLSGALRQLLSVDSDMTSNAKDTVGMGNTRVAEQSLPQADLDVNLADEDGRTALSYAAQEGEVEIVELLLRQKDIDINVADRSRRTALSYAVEEGEVKVVELLLQKEELDLNLVDKFHQTVLSNVTESGRVDIVQRLLRRKDLDINVADQCDRTVLLNATISGRVDIVKLLLQRKDLDINVADQSHRTALSYAAEGNVEIVELLLQQVNLNVNSADISGRTALWYAAGSEESGTRVIKLLLEANIDVNSANWFARTVLSSAAGDGRVEIVELLLQQPDLDVNLADRSGRTALSYAAEEGRVEIVELLLHRKDVDVNCVDRFARTALSYAAKKGNVGVVRLLLQRKDLNVKLADHWGKTALSYAKTSVSEGRAAVIQLLAMSE